MCQSHTGRLTGLWFLPKPAFGLNTNDDDIYIYIFLSLRHSTSGLSEKRRCKKSECLSGWRPKRAEKSDWIQNIYTFISFNLGLWSHLLHEYWFLYADDLVTDLFNSIHKTIMWLNILPNVNEIFCCCYLFCIIGDVAWIVWNNACSLVKTFSASWSFVA